MMTAAIPNTQQFTWTSLILAKVSVTCLYSVVYITPPPHPTPLPPRLFLYIKMYELLLLLNKNM